MPYSCNFWHGRPVMKISPTLTSIAFLCIFTNGANATNGFSSRVTSLLQTSETDESAEHQALVSGLRREEQLARAEREALLMQQRSLQELRQEQGILESRAAAMESSDLDMDSQKFIMQRGTLRNMERSTLSYEAKESDLVRPHLFMHSRGGSRINVTETEEMYWDRQNKAFIEHVTAICFYMLATLLAGFIYIQCMEKSVGMPVPDSAIHTDDFQFGAFDCNDVGRDWQICLCAWCCEWVRWADTASHPQIDLLAFWPAIFITALLSATASITYGATIPILLLIVVYCRQRIRLAYGLPSGTCGVLAWDCCLWLCCPCCAIVQEARQVEYVQSKLVPYYEDGTPQGGYGP